MRERERDERESEQHYQSRLCSKLPKLQMDVSKSVYPLTDSVRAVWKQSITTKGSGSWLVTRPSSTTSLKSLSNDAVQLAAAMRAAFNLTSEQPQQRCPLCKEDLRADDIFHYLTCKQATFTTVHDELKLVMAQIGRDLKLVVAVEPKHIKSDQDNRRADVAFAYAGTRVITDISRVNSFAPSNLPVAGRHPGKAVDARDTQKINYYKRMAELNRYKFIPCAVDCLGGYGKKGAPKLFDALRDAADSGGVDASLLNAKMRDARQTFAIAVQRGNWHLYHNYQVAADMVAVKGRFNRLQGPQPGRRGRRQSE